MISSLFQAVFFTSIQMSVPLLTALLLIPTLRKNIRADTLLKIEKVLFIGLAVTLILFDKPLIHLSIDSPAPFVKSPSGTDIFLSENIERFSSILAKESTTTLVSNIVLDSPILGAFWFLGMLFFILSTVFRYVLFFSIVRHSCFTVPPAFIVLCSQQCRELKIRTLPEIRISAKILSPLTIGWIHPVILLSPSNLTDSYENLNLLFRHELNHCKQRDNCWRAIALLVVAVYWFNPLVWLLFSCFSLDDEIACDEKVLQGCPAKTRKDYAKLLVSSIEENSAIKPSMPLQSGLKSNLAAMKLRIDKIKLPSQHSGLNLLVLCSFVMLLLSGIVGFDRVNQTTTFRRIGISVLNSPLSISILHKNNPEEAEANQLTSKTTFLAPLATDNVINRKCFDKEKLMFLDTLYFFPTGENKEVTACANGEVIDMQTKEIEELDASEEPLRAYGKYVVLDCGNGLTVRYAFLGSVAVEPGQRVSAGEVLGTAGHTGLSYGDADQCGVFVMQDGVMVDPLPFFVIDAPVQEVS